LLLSATIAIVAASPATAEETPFVPPENSAVNQYTESFPTAGGDKDAHDHDGGNRSPKKVLGSRNAEKLRAQGPAGEATAELVAETAPAVEKTGDAGTGVPPRTGGDSGGGADGGKPVAADSPAIKEAGGSSGVSEVIAWATGSSPAGGVGIFLPLLIIATVLWAFAYLARQRRPVG